MEENKEQIQQAETMEDRPVTFEIKVTKNVQPIKERIIKIPEIVMQSEDELKMSILERERKIITKEVEAEF